jgi:major membrane immunogen (membrane-anchored lipoprotein)
VRGYILVSALLIAAGIAAFAGGGQESSEGPTLDDGIYFAQADEFGEKSGWKHNVTLRVEDGRVVSAVWNGAHVDAGTDKKTRSKSGEYGMVETGGAMARWWEQAEAVEAWFVATQETSMPDAVSGATIDLEDFFVLAGEALEEGPVGFGPYRDGVYRAEQDTFNRNYRYFVELLVTSGYIVAANWDAPAEDGTKNKQQASRDGEYGMVEKAGAVAPWWEQARAVEDHFLLTQDPSLPDAVSGATIGLEEFFTLAGEALEGAKRG